MTRIARPVSAPKPSPSPRTVAAQRPRATTRQRLSLSEDRFEASSARQTVRPSAATYDGVTPAPGTTVPEQWLPTTPPLHGDPQNPSAALYTQVINQFAVGSNARYTPQGDATYCNIFAWDVMSAMGAPLPHWVTGSGAPAQPFQSGAHELSADGVNDWLNQSGAQYGWRQVSASEAQALANQGYPTVVSYNSGDASPGHIAVVRPGQLEDGSPEIAQAGATNTNDTHVSHTFGSRPVQYWVNDSGAPAGKTPAPTPTPSPTGASAPSAQCTYDGGQRYDPNVEQLQRALVQTGFMTQAQMDTGPGYYGPKTKAAVAALQAKYGIADDGTNYGPKTRAALTQELAQAAPSPKPSPAPSPTPAPSQPPSDANGIQRWDVPYINQMYSAGSADDWNASSNCGPTTMAMIAKGLGYGRDQVDGTLVNHFDQVAGVGADGVGYDGIQTMAQSCGFSSQVQNAPTADWVRQQLAQGKLVAANGDRRVTLENEQPPYASGSATGGHWIAVVGTTKDGNFLVQDPSTTCKVLTPDQLERFFRAHGSDGGWAVSIGNGQKGSSSGTSAGSPATGVGAPSANCTYDGGSRFDSNVEALQRALVKAGYLSQSAMDTGPGYYGPQTKAAVAALQRDYGIDDDGSNYGPLTRAALSQALSGQ